MELRKIEDDTLVVRASAALSAELGDEWALLNAETGMYFGLENVGALIWQVLAEPTSFTGLRDELVRVYDVDESVAGHDLSIFLRELLDKGLIQIAPLV